MTALRCPRTFEAEAMRDGRLVGVERARFERHLAACPACSHEARALESVAEALRVLPERTPDELHVRRERTRLLAAFDGALVQPERRKAARAWSYGLGAAALAFTGALVSWRAQPAVHLAKASGAVVRASGAAVWSEHRDAGRERVVIEQGTLFIHVEHPSVVEHLVVALPDGELEDVGTTFTVTAAEGHTTLVMVREGSVVLRLRGRLPVAIRAGYTWTANTEPTPLSAPAGLTPAPAPAFPLVAAPADPVGSTLPRFTRTAPRSDEPSDASAAFRAAMAAFDGGDSRDAAARFSRFVVEHPRDPRAEDAAYLRVVALFRAGAGTDMKEAAERYLRRYPNGFRRAEVERMSAR